ncbi:MAG: methylenetetrahydrofolate--tRNA-(uracil(54)-C(5))-methyltransferase (FADH(2)-oxidizing) TrmFO [Thermosulfidibacteraceae bacterium]
MKVIVVGAGLAGVEIVNVLNKAGVKVLLYEMRPVRMTPAHKTPYFGELVCSNSLKSTEITDASGLLKEEMKRLGSIIIHVAIKTSVPAGKALAVNRNEFAIGITRIIESMKNVEIVRSEIREIPDERPCVIASGPLTSDDLAESIRRFLGEDNLYFFDAISPIIDGETIDYSKGFWASRYDPNSKDYFNIPLNEEEYNRFYNELMKAEVVEYKEFEKGVKYFEGCMPIEELARRGRDTLLFGPMKPVGLIDPRTGKEPFAVVQLRREDREGRMFNIVGFQTKMKWPEQERVFRLIPGLENAEFLRYGGIHRNTYINSPKVLNATLSTKKDPLLFFAGQITGVEGYLESGATGIIAGVNAARIVKGLDPVVPPAETMIGSLINYIVNANPRDFQPMNANFGLLPPLEVKVRGKMERRKLLAERALKVLEEWMMENNLEFLR